MEISVKMTNSKLDDAKKNVKDLLNVVDKEIDIYRDTAVRYCGNFSRFMLKIFQK